MLHARVPTLPVRIFEIGGRSDGAFSVAAILVHSGVAHRTDVDAILGAAEPIVFRILRIARLVRNDVVRVFLRIVELEATESANTLLAPPGREDGVAPKVEW